MTVVYGRTHSRPNEWRALGRPPVVLGGRASLVAGTYRPDATTTGVPAGVTLTTYAPGGSTPKIYLDEAWINTNGGRAGDGRYYLQRLDIHAQVEIRADNVTIRECRIRGYANAYGTEVPLIRHWAANVGLIVEDTTIDPGANARVGQDGIHGTGYIARRVEVLNTVDGFKLRGAACLIEACRVRGLKWYADDPQQTDGSHSDCIQILGGGPHVMVGNDFTAEPGIPGCIMATQGNGVMAAPLTFDRNWFTGGSVTANFAETGKGPIVAVFTDNVFGGSVQNKDITMPATSIAASTFTGNVKTNGQPATVHNG